MPDMTPQELKEARHALDLSAAGLAAALGVGSGRTVRRWEEGTRPVPGPVIVLIDLLLTMPAVRRRLLPE